MKPPTNSPCAYLEAANLTQMILAMRKYGRGLKERDKSPNDAFLEWSINYAAKFRLIIEKFKTEINNNDLFFAEFQNIEKIESLLYEKDSDKPKE